jgi:aminopeptidase N
MLMHGTGRLQKAVLGSLLLTSCATAPASVPEVAFSTAVLAPGVTRELARHRSATISAVTYAVELDVTAADHAVGAVTIGLERTGDADVVLDFRGRSLDGVEVNDTPVPGATWDEHHVVVPARHLMAGRNVLRLRFTAPIAPAGAAIIAFEDPRDNARYLYTLLVPSDAQLLFPVFDQPDLKAQVSWSIVTPAGWRVVANGPQERTEPLDEGRVRHDFAATEPISTYTAAFAAGPWTVLRDTARAAAAEPHPVADGMTLWVRRTRAAEVDADTLLRLNRDALRWLEDWFGVTYPFEKLDLVLAPAFPFGGMEHVGAIFYNESNFIFREPPTMTRTLARAATIYHEVAHQWFGDLVTMEWFDDLWLKEGFSTFMAAKIQDELQPTSNAWKTFYIRNKPLAYAVDVTPGTTPVWQELPNLDLAKSNYGPIVYNKAPSILKQLEFLVGEEVFRSGLQEFLRRHAYGNATWRDLLTAIGTAAGADLREFGEHYILRPGIPLVETELALDSRGRIASLTLVQRPAAAMPGDRGGAWPGRVRVRLGYQDAEDQVLDVTFRGERTQVRAARGLPAPDFVFANDGDYGYGIFLPDARSAAWILQHGASLEDELLRAMAWGAAWDLVREGRIAPELFAEAALRAFEQERDEQIAGLLLGRATYALERYLPDGSRSAALGAALEELLLRRVADSSLGYGLRRASLDAFLAGARTQRGVRVLKEYLRGTRQFGGAPLAPPSRWAAVTRLLVLDDGEARALYAAEQERDTTAEAARMAFIAGAAQPTAANKAAYYERYFSDETLNEEWVTASLAAFNHADHADLTLPYLTRALESAEWLRDNRRIFFLPRWLDAFIGGHASPEALDAVDKFLSVQSGLPDDIRRRVLQARDELARAIAIRERGYR